MGRADVCGILHAKFNAICDVPPGPWTYSLSSTSALINYAVSGISALNPSPFQLVYNQPALATLETLYVLISLPTSREALMVAEARRLAAHNSSRPPHSTHPSVAQSKISAATRSPVPANADWDISLLGSTSLTERTRLQFRAEFFNDLNHTNPLTPNEVVFASGPRQGMTAKQTAPAVLNPPAGVMTAASTSRQIRLTIKLVF